jgi:hypothetical protein
MLPTAPRACRSTWGRVFRLGALRLFHEEEPEWIVNGAGMEDDSFQHLSLPAKRRNHTKRITCFSLNIAVAKLAQRGSFQSSFRHGTTYGACRMCASAVHSWHISRPLPLVSTPARVSIPKAGEGCGWFGYLQQPREAHWRLNIGFAK